jgi:hypothetical protein
MGRISLSQGLAFPETVFIVVLTAVTAHGQLGTGGESSGVSEIGAGVPSFSSPFENMGGGEEIFSNETIANPAAENTLLYRGDAVDIYLYSFPGKVQERQQLMDGNADAAAVVNNASVLLQNKNIGTDTQDALLDLCALVTRPNAGEQLKKEAVTEIINAASRTGDIKGDEFLMLFSGLRFLSENSGVSSSLREYMVPALLDKSLDPAVPAEIRTQLMSAAFICLKSHPGETGLKETTEEFLSRHNLLNAGNKEFWVTHGVFVFEKDRRLSVEEAGLIRNTLNAVSQGERPGATMIILGLKSSQQGLNPHYSKLMQHISIPDLEQIKLKSGQEWARNYIRSLSHEFGHAVYYEKLKVEERNTWSELWARSDREAPQYYVSDYAKTTREEDFAETYASYILGIRNKLAVGAFFADTQTKEPGVLLEKIGLVSQYFGHKKENKEYTYTFITGDTGAIEWQETPLIRQQIRDKTYIMPDLKVTPQTLVQDYSR